MHDYISTFLDAALDLAQSEGMSRLYFAIVLNDDQSLVNNLTLEMQRSE